MFSLKKSLSKYTDTQIDPCPPPSFSTKNTNIYLHMYIEYRYILLKSIELNQNNFLSVYSIILHIYIQLYILYDTQILISSSLVKIKIYCFETIFLLSSSTSLWLGVRDSAPSPGPSRGSRSAPCYTDPLTTTASVAGTLCP